MARSMLGTAVIGACRRAAAMCARAANFAVAGEPSNEVVVTVP